MQISVGSDGSTGVRVSISMVWARKPFGEVDCRNVYICHECFWAIQQHAYGDVTGGRELYRYSKSCDSFTFAKNKHIKVR